MCKIGVKTRKPVKSVKPGQTRLKTGQLGKNVKNVTFSRVKQNFQQKQNFEMPYSSDSAQQSLSSILP
jgi:hypothetical protein